jgi:hypothetical protein
MFSTSLPILPGVEFCIFVSGKSLKAISVLFFPVETYRSSGLQSAAYVSVTWSYFPEQGFLSMPQQPAVSLFDRLYYCKPWHIYSYMRLSFF